MLREERPSVQRTKRGTIIPPDPMPGRLLRRRFSPSSTWICDYGRAEPGVLASYVQGRRAGVPNGESASTRGKTGGKPTFVQAVEFSDTDELILSEGFCYEFIPVRAIPLTANQVTGDHNDYVAYFSTYVLEGGEESEDGIHRSSMSI